MRSSVRLAVCVRNVDCEASLEVGRFYRVIPDQSAEEIGYLRVADESGADCGYPADRFFVLDQDDAEKGVIRGEKAEMKVDLSVIRANMRLTATERARQADHGRRVALAAQHRGGE
jgi:hypothetical protein